MGRRYPGSLLARVLINRYHHWCRQHSKPKTQPGRLDAAKDWFLQWEGLLVGGLFVSGVAALAVRLFSEERADDINRRHERRQFYEGSCLMVATHLASVQHSHGFWAALGSEAAARCQQRQAWQEQQRQHLLAAAVQLQLWEQRVRAAGCCYDGHDGQLPPGGRLATPAAGSALEPAAAGAARAAGGNDSSKGAHKQQQAAGDLSRVGQARQAGADQQDSEGTDRATDSCDSSSSVIPFEHTQNSSSSSSSGSNNGAEQRGRQWQQWNPACWLLRRRLQALHEQLLQEQQQLVLGDLGLGLWQQLADISSRQVRALQQQQAAQQLLLMSHANQLAVWQGLESRVEPIPGFGFDAPRVVCEPWLICREAAAAVATAACACLAGGSCGDGAAMDCRTKAADTGREQQRQQQQQQGQEAAGAGGSSRAERLLQAVRHPFGSSTRQQQGAGPVGPAAAAPAATGDHAADSSGTTSSSNGSSGSSSGGSGLSGLWRWLTRRQQPPPQQHAVGAAPSAASTATHSQQQAPPQQGHQGGSRKRWSVRVRVLLPQWVPADVEERDYELVSREHLERTGAAAAAAAGVSHPDDGDGASERYTYTTDELDGGGSGGWDEHGMWQS